MSGDREAAIRERAYHLWVEGGRRDGADEQDWLRAEREHDPAPAAAKRSAAKGAAKKPAPKKDGPAKAAAKPAGRSRAADGRPATRA